MTTQNSFPTTCVKPTANHGIIRVIFDASNEAHRISAQSFFNTGEWGMIQFYAEAPYLTVPETVSRKLLAFYFSGDKAIVNET